MATLKVPLSVSVSLHLFHPSPWTSLETKDLPTSASLELQADLPQNISANVTKQEIPQNFHWFWTRFMDSWAKTGHPVNFPWAAFPCLLLWGSRGCSVKKKTYSFSGIVSLFSCVMECFGDEHHPSNQCKPSTARPSRTRTSATVEKPSRIHSRRGKKSFKKNKRTR